MKELLIWTYHRVLPETGPGAVSVDEFEKEIAFLAERGCRFLDAAGLKDWLDNPASRTRRCAMLTFDDGWADNLIWATPILKKYAARAVIAISTSLVNQKRTVAALAQDPASYKIIHYKKALEDAVYGRGNDSFLTWDELSKMRDSGVWDIQSHAHSHLGCYPCPLGKLRGFHPEKTHWTMCHALGEAPFAGAPRAEFRSILASPKTSLAADLVDMLKKAPDDEARIKLCASHPNPVIRTESDIEFRARLKNEFEESRRLFTEKLGLTPSALVWPWGQDSASSREAALEAGFKLLLTTRKDAVSSQSDPASLPRIAAPDTFERFRKQEKIFSSPILRRLRAVFGKKSAAQE